MKIYGLQFSGAATNHFDVPVNGVLQSVYGTVAGAMLVSYSPTRTAADVTTPSVQGNIISDVIQYSPNSSGWSTRPQENLGIPVSAGERLFATATAAGTIFFGIDETVS
jgi:hypothetical protein